MKRMLINATQHEELRVAMVDGQRLYDLDIANDTYKQKKSNIYKGKIIHIEQSLEAVFVDYGTKKHGFLPFKEINNQYITDNSNNILLKKENIKEYLYKGKELIVQINKEERGNKGASLTTFISLAGTYLVLMPNSPKVGGISKRIEGEKRNELKEILLTLKLPKEMGLIIRTAGLGKKNKELEYDLQFRLKHWKLINKIANSKPAPFLIHQESNIIMRAFRDYLTDINEILIDNPEILKLAKEYINLLGRSDFNKKIKLYSGKIPLFSHYQIESQIETAFQRKVNLLSGGSIVIDTTEALTSVDVNSAKATKGIDIEETAFNINLEATDEIARQLRLRDIGGLIVIDFIDMSPTENQRAVEQRLRDKLRQDRAKIQMNHISKFGLLEMSRQRISSSLRESSHYMCPRCIGNGTIRDNKSLSLSILRLIEEESFKENTKEVYAIVPVKIASYLLNEKRKSVNAIENRKNGIRTFIIPNDQIETPNYSILRIRHGEDKKNINDSITKTYNLNYTFYHKKNYKYPHQSLKKNLVKKKNFIQNKNISIKNQNNSVRENKIFNYFLKINNIIKKFFYNIIYNKKLNFNNIIFSNFNKKNINIIKNVFLNKNKQITNYFKKKYDNNINCIKKIKNIFNQIKLNFNIKIFQTIIKKQNIFTFSKLKIIETKNQLILKKNNLLKNDKNKFNIINLKNLSYAFKDTDKNYFIYKKYYSFYFNNIYYQNIFIINKIPNLLITKTVRINNKINSKINKNIINNLNIQKNLIFNSSMFFYQFFYKKNNIHLLNYNKKFLSKINFHIKDNLFLEKKKSSKIIINKKNKIIKKKYIFEKKIFNKNLLFRKKQSNNKHISLYYYKNNKLIYSLCNMENKNKGAGGHAANRYATAPAQKP
ncbi:ribonuclease E [Enterobacteriaceae endosymbiont of Plateumaris sericea]|uniref:ribonuclease E n=1 Tax=Enterobacteriaceae endosymbiont of Plateumaris sericea TaxID=2675797 RepID=UPI001448DF40|nr:ribonuclease E [Enterobacteriaceae endosymbiont of Plateumaris sericea]QJC29829.1 ribonuclease E [Enterobacteriaceae endosymbiont of Plateumaris sericea]